MKNFHLTTLYKEVVLTYFLYDQGVKDQLFDIQMIQLNSHSIEQIFKWKIICDDSAPCMHIILLLKCHSDVKSTAGYQEMYNFNSLY